MAATPMSLTEQQMQPFARGTKGTGAADVEFASETVSCFSMSMARQTLVDKDFVTRQIYIQSPNSLRITAIFLPCCSVRM